MIHIGDIVRPIESCIGHQFEFVVRYDSPLPKFKLKATNNIIDPMYGPYEKQMEEMKRAEELEWCANDLELVKNGPTLSQALEANHILFEEFLSSDDVVDSLAYAIEEYNKNIKEDKTMKILDIYRERKEFEINQNYIKNRNEIIKEDEIQKIIREMELQINTILDIEERLDRVDFSSRNEELLTNVSKEKLEKLEAETDKERDKLHDNIEEIKALFELTEDYEERMKILKKYDIINKDGKVSI